MNKTKVLEELLYTIENVIKGAGFYPEDEYATSEMLINSYSLREMSIAYENFIEYLDNSIDN